MSPTKAFKRKAKLIAGQFVGTAIILYFFLYAFPFPLGYVPKTDKVYDKLNSGWDKLLGKLVPKLLQRLHKEVPYESVTVSDSLAAWLRCFVLLGIAVALAAAICSTSRRTRIADWLHKWGSLYLRCFLSFTILYYAAIKIVRQQFPFPLLERFLTPFGGSSPQGLLWTFMGYSRGYSFIAGALELLGATLLLFRRTAAGGALLLTAVLANVVAVNVFYDVQVKLFSLNLLALALFFLFPTLGRLADVLLFDRDSQAPLRYVSAETRRRELIVTGVTVLCAAAIFGFNVKSARDFVKRRFQKPVPAWWGIYEVGDVAKDGVSVGSLDPLHWTALIVDRGTGDSDELAVRNGLAPWTRYRIRQQADGSFALSTEEGPVGHLAFSGAQDEFVEARGDLNQSQLIVELRRADPENLPLLNGKIHWVHKPGVAKPAP